MDINLDSKKAILKILSKLGIQREFRYFIYRKGLYKPSQYPIILLHKYKAAYIPIPKVANTSLRNFFAQTLDQKVVNQKLGFNYTDFFKSYNSLVNSKEKLNKKYSHYWSFCFVRNPWDRLVSCYSEKIKKSSHINNTWFCNGVSLGLLRYGVFRANMSFEDFVYAISSIPNQEADPHFKSQYTFLTTNEGKLIPHFIGKLENLNEDLFFICKTLQINNGLEIPHYLKSKRLHYREYYTEELKKLVASRYAKDIELFDYKF